MKRRLRDQMLRLAKKELSNTENELRRAEFSFHGLTPQMMEQEHGESGASRQQVLSEYRASYQAALELVNFLEERDSI